MNTQNLKEKVLQSLADETLVDMEPTFRNAHIQKALGQLDSELVGLKSAKTIDFPDYTIDELLAIACIILKAQHYHFSSDAKTAFRDYLARQISRPHFVNAQSVRNALEQGRLRQVNRLLARSGKSVTKKDLMTIEVEDIEREQSIPDCLVA